MSWAELMRRVFALDVLQCPQYGGAMRIMAVVHDRQSVRAILESLRLPARAPPATPAHGVRSSTDEDFPAELWPDD